MQDIVQELGMLGVEVSALGVSLVWLSKRIGRIEDQIDRKLNNGIRSELTGIKVQIGKIETKLGMSD